MGIISRMIGLLIFFFVFMVLLLGGTKMCMGTPLGWLYRRITCQSEKKKKSTSKNQKESEETGIFSRFLDYLLNQKNPIIQIFYAVLALGLAVGWFITVFPFVPSPSVSKIHMLWCLFLIFTSLFLFFFVSMADPGFLNSKNVNCSLAVFPYDNILYCMEKICPVCKIPRPPRSKHCSLCNSCVSKMDHHCPWFNTCVGEKNFRWFVLFLLSNGLGSFHLGLSALQLCLEIARRTDMYHKTVDVGGQQVYVDKMVMFQFLVKFKPGGCILALYGIIVGVFVVCFGLWQLKSAITNTTTNESFKHDDLRDQAKVAQRLLATNFRSAPRLVPYRMELQRDLAVEHVNIYNKGVVTNLCEFAFPLSSRAAASSAERLRPPRDLLGRPRFACLFSSASGGGGDGDGDYNNHGKAKATTNAAAAAAAAANTPPQQQSTMGKEKRLLFTTSSTSSVSGGGGGSDRSSGGGGKDGSGKKKKKKRK